MELHGQIILIKSQQNLCTNHLITYAQQLSIIAVSGALLALQSENTQQQKILKAKNI